jgi:GT2 family glycosyltransferase
MTVKLIEKSYPKIRIIPARGNLGYGRSVNLGFSETVGSFVLLSNSDVIYTPGSIERMVEFLRETPDAGLVGPQQIFPNGNWQWSYGDLPGVWSGLKSAVGITTFQHACRHWLWPRKIDRKPKDVPYVGGAALLTRREAFQAVGGFDEGFFRYGDETDLCARMHKAGWRTIFFPGAELVHVRGGDSTQIATLELFRNMVEADIKVARKHLSPGQVTAYCRLKQIEFQRLALMYGFLRIITPKRMTDIIRQKSTAARDLANIWRHNSRLVLRSDS